MLLVKPKYNKTNILNVGLNQIVATNTTAGTTLKN